MVKQHPYWKPADKIHPDIQPVREKAGAITEAEQKKIDDAKKSEALRQERKRRKFLENHGINPDAPTTDYSQGVENQVRGLNYIEGGRMGRKDAKIRPTDFTLREPAKYRNYGRISRQSPDGIPTENKGFRSSMREIEIAMKPGKFTSTRTPKASAQHVKVEEYKKGRVFGVTKEEYGYLY